MKALLTTQPAAIALETLLKRELATAMAANERDDTEALHDFRVALRHLDVLVKHLARQSTLRRKVLFTINGLMKQSDRCRDAQVMYAWLKAEWPQLKDQDLAGAWDWQQNLERVQNRCLLKAKPVSAILKGLERPLAKLSPPASGKPLPFGLHVACQLERQSGKLMALIIGENRQEQLHLIRLRIKTLRYLLLPVCDVSPTCTTAEEALHQLQQLLGDWHDTVIRQMSLRNSLRKAVRRNSSKSHNNKNINQRDAVPRELPGLIKLARSNQLLRQRLTGRIRQQFLRENPSLLDSLQQAIAAIRLAVMAQNQSVSLPVLDSNTK